MGVSQANAATPVSTLKLILDRLSGTADFLAEVVVADLRAYEALLTERLLVLPMVADIRSTMSLRRVKSEAFLPLPCP